MASQLYRSLCKYNDIQLVEFSDYIFLVYISVDENGHIYHYKVDGEAHIFDNINGVFEYVENSPKIVVPSIHVTDIPEHLLNSWVCGRRFTENDYKFLDSQDHISANGPPGSSALMTAHKALSSIGLSTTRPLRVINEHKLHVHLTLYFTFSHEDVQVVESTEPFNDSQDDREELWDFRHTYARGYAVAHVDIITDRKAKKLSMFFLLYPNETILTAVKRNLAKRHLRLLPHVERIDDYSSRGRGTLNVRYVSEYSVHIDDCVKYSPSLNVYEPMSPAYLRAMNAQYDEIAEVAAQYGIYNSLSDLTKRPNFKTFAAVILHGENVERFKRVLDGTSFGNEVKGVDGLTLVRARDWEAWKDGFYRTSEHRDFLLETEYKKLTI